MMATSMNMKIICNLTAILLLLCISSDGFVAPRTLTHPLTFLPLAKAGKGFGKAKEPSEMKPRPVSDNTISSSPSKPAASLENSYLTSVNVDNDIDSNPMPDKNLPPEERTKLLLREKYGLKPIEEQQADAKQLEALIERRKKQQEWQKKAQQEPDFDLMTALPAPVLVGIDRFLKAGVVVCGTLFIIAGLFITVEAWSKTSGQPLPTDLDNFIVTIVEPNFTPGLLVLLSFSVGLGLFAAAQLGSSGASYKED
ncbi:hypothetical protein MPSEU_000195200 [Mayamaea pseudoterrestris]|nr:hypothetical protein MPSEU_000195200 [Mayamaea pseudoterrestris]